MSAEKWTPERVAALRRTIENARRFVRLADEFIPEDGRWFHPEGIDEAHSTLEGCFAIEAATWDEDAVTTVSCGVIVDGVVKVCTCRSVVGTGIQRCPAHPAASDAGAPAQDGGP